MLNTMEYGVDIYAIIDRIKDEAENEEQMAMMLKEEVYQYMRFRDLYKPYYIEMWKVPEIDDDVVIIGMYAETEEAYNCEDYNYIIPLSYIDEDGNYKVVYKRGE